MKDRAKIENELAGSMFREEAYKRTKIGVML
jgi:hypothetical protein